MRPSGEKLGHSYSPAIHGELADYEYKLYEKSPEQLEDFLKKGDWDGLNVTIPYKKTVIPFWRGAFGESGGDRQRQYPRAPPRRQHIRGQYRRLRL